ncbi:MAG: WD40/YVTN/BNR-like repeat-containing protein [Thermoanaerobaculia bacterium]
MRKFLGILILAAVASPLSAGWHRAGLYGADVRALIVHPKNPDVVFVGTSQGEVYASTDGAKSWKNPRSGVPFPGYVVDNLTVDSLGRLWAASWGLWGGGVIAVSYDGGATWERRDSGLEDFSVRALTIDPSDPHHVVAGGLTGVYRSVDSGKAWTKISDQINVESLAIDPRNRGTIYVGTWRQAWRTDDGGRNWKHIATGMVLDTDVFSINIEPSNPDSVWLSTCGWVYNSPDRGDTWTRFRDGFNNRRVHTIDIDPTRSERLFAGSVAGLYRSEDRGTTWTLTSDESLVINAVGLHRARPDRVILGTEGDGVYVSNDGGATFARSSDGLYNVRVAAIATDPDIKGRIYAAVLFGGAASGIYKSGDRGENWSKLSTTKLPEVLSLVVSKDGSTRFIAGTERGFFYSADGVEWTQAEPSAAPIRVDEVISYNDLRLFAATSAGVYTSKDAGKSWYRLLDHSEKTVDIAVGNFGKKRALYALTARGVMMYDGDGWRDIAGSPAQGRSLAVRQYGHREELVVAGLKGTTSGTPGPDYSWSETARGTQPYALVLETSRSDERWTFLAHSERNEIAISSSGSQRPRKTWAPIDPKTISDVIADPFERSRYFVATTGQGILIYISQPDTAVADSDSSGIDTATAAGGGR